LRAALIDPERRESTLVLVLFIYWLVWTAYATISKGGQGLHPDMTELIAWSRDPALGYFKHPPLAAWLVTAWFAAFPVSEPAYYLLAMLMPVLALWIAWRLMGDYLDADKRVFGLALLTLVPFFNFHALKYNVNTVLLPLWAATTFWFLRSYRLRHAGYAALAGLGAAACMYGKYWSVVLLAGLFVAAVIDRRRGAYFRSPAPWITAGVGLIALAPHLYWLTANHFAPFSYAVGVHGEKPFTGVLLSTLSYLAGSLAYVALPVVLVLIAARPRPATLADMAWPADDDSSTTGNRVQADIDQSEVISVCAAIAPITGSKSGAQNAAATACVRRDLPVRGPCGRAPGGALHRRQGDARIRADAAAGDAGRARLAHDDAAALALRRRGHALVWRRCLCDRSAARTRRTAAARSGGAQARWRRLCLSG
jgi:hypothetical protein